MKPYIIGIAGPSGAGKSELCRRMQKEVPNVTRLKLDDFFINSDEIPKKGEWLDWDRPDAIKWDLLIQAAKDLKAGRQATAPNYSRKEDRVIGEKLIQPSEIILIDGFMTLYNKELREMLDYSIFLRLSEHSQIRRRKERQPWVEDGYIQEVMLPAARKYIIPSAKYADKIINAELSKNDVASDALKAIRTHYHNYFLTVSQ